MSAGLKLQTNIVDEAVTVLLNGSMDEDAELASLQGLNCQKYIFDFDAVTFVNSCGVREWIKFIETLPSEATVVYRKCPQIIVEQLNMVKGFIRPGGTVESFYAPYFDESEDCEVKKLIRPEDVSGGKAPVLKNDKGEELEFDGIEDQYFSFLKTLKMSGKS